MDFEKLNAQKKEMDRRDSIYDFKKYVLERCSDAIDMYREYVEKHGEEDLSVAKAKAVLEILDGMNAEEEMNRADSQ